MRLEHREPEHRCKCGTPLSFENNHIRDVTECDELINQLNWWGRLTTSRLSFMVDNKIQYWSCPKCFESYLVDLREHISVEEVRDLEERGFIK